MNSETYIKQQVLTQFSLEDKKRFVKEFTYKKAKYHFETEQYQEALDLFASVGNYEQSIMYNF